MSKLPECITGDGNTGQFYSVYDKTMLDKEEPRCGDCESVIAAVASTKPTDEQLKTVLELRVARKGAKLQTLVDAKLLEWKEAGEDVNVPW